MRVTHALIDLAELDPVVLGDDIEEGTDVERVASMALVELVVYALVTQELLNLYQDRLDFLKDLTLLERVLLVLQRNKLEVKARLSDHFHVLALVGGVR